jgi:hypothetical protein
MCGLCHYRFMLCSYQQIRLFYGLSSTSDSVKIDKKLRLRGLHADFIMQLRASTPENGKTRLGFNQGALKIQSIYEAGVS